jgi:hypothetical protein
MTFVAKFNDGSGTGSSYLVKTAPASALHTINETLLIPAATLAAVLSAMQTASQININDNTEGVFGDYSFASTWLWWTFGTPDDPTVPVVAGVPLALKTRLDFDSGTSWLVTPTIGGTPIVAPYVRDLGFADTDPVDFWLGGANGSGVPGEIYYLYLAEVLGAADAVIISDDFSSGSFSPDWDDITGNSTVVDGIGPNPPVSSLIGIRNAFGYAAYDPDALFVRLDDPNVPGLQFDGSAHNVTGWKIDRGRTYELDKTQAGTAELDLFDTSGIFDPTNSASPLAGLIGPMQQTKIGVQNPWTGAYTDLFTGFLESWKWSMTSDETLMMIAMGLVDGFEPLTRAEIPPGSNGTTIFAATSDVQTRIDALLDIAAWPTATGWRNVNTGNVFVQRTVYNPQTSVLSAIQDAGDSDFPGVANFFMRKGGAAAFLGRYPRFKPELFPQDVQFWTCGDKGAVSAFGGAAIKNIEWELDNKNLINAALALPFGINQNDIAAQLVFDAPSIAQFGVRTKSLPDLLVDGQPMSTFQPALDANAVCLAYAQYYVSNYSQPVIRISTLEFEVVLGTLDTPAATWDLVLGVEIGDILTIYTSNPGGGGFGKGTGGNESPTPAQFFVEGIHYQAAFVGDVPVLKLSLDVSPRTWFLIEPWAN